MKHVSFLAVFGALVVAANLGRLDADIVPGDVAIVGFRFDNPDEVSFVALNDLAEGDSFNITDNGWLAAGQFRGGEGTETFTVGAGGISTGSVVDVAISGPAFSASGDQIFFYTGTVATPTLLFGLHSDGADWSAEASSANASSMPSDLLLAPELKLAVPEVDNAAYTAGPISGTRSALLAAMSDSGNWSGSNSGAVDPPLSFAVVAVPEPSSLTLLGLVGWVGAVRRRK